MTGPEIINRGVEVDVSPRATAQTILVGLPEAAVRESTHRVERAIVNSGFQRPHDRVVINLAPASYPSRRRRSICRSRWASWRAAASSPRTVLDNMPSWASCRWKATPGRTRARSPWPWRRRGSRACGGW